MWYSNGMFNYMLKAEFVTLVSLKVPSGSCVWVFVRVFFLRWERALTCFPSFPPSYVRAEVLAGFINGLFLLFISFFIFSEAVERLVEPPEVKHERLLVVSILGFLVNLIGIFIFQHGGAGGHHGHSHGGGAGDHGHGHGHSHGGGGHGHSHSGSDHQIMKGVRAGLAVLCSKPNFMVPTFFVVIVITMFLYFLRCSCTFWRTHWAALVSSSPPSSCISLGG